MGAEPAREAVARYTGRALRSERSAAAEHHGVQRGVGEGLAFANLAVAPGLVEGLDAGAGDVDEGRGQWFGALADERPGSDPIGEHSSTPLVTGEPQMGLEEAAALMVQHRIRRLPVVEDDELVGIVTLDDIAVRSGNLEVAQRMTHQVIEGALPEFFFHERG